VLGIQLVKVKYIFSILCGLERNQPFHFGLLYYYRIEIMCRNHKRTGVCNAGHIGAGPGGGEDWQGGRGAFYFVALSNISYRNDAGRQYGDTCNSKCITTLEKR
jgi:hypothetical protein